MSAPDLLKALERLLDRYIGLANSGDCGNWDPETEDEVIAARAALTASSVDMVPVASTVAAKWREAGEPDPHGTRYDCERAALCMGSLTDDELANAVFMEGDKPFNVEDVLAGKPAAHAYLTAAKDRIRWLSRKLADAHPVPAKNDGGAA